MNTAEVVANVLREWVYDRERIDLPDTPGEVANQIILAIYAAGWRIIPDDRFVPSPRKVIALHMVYPDGTHAGDCAGCMWSQEEGVS